MMRICRHIGEEVKLIVLKMDPAIQPNTTSTITQIETPVSPVKSTTSKLKYYLPFIVVIAVLIVTNGIAFYGGWHTALNSKKLPQVTPQNIVPQTDSKPEATPNASAPPVTEHPSSLPSGWTYSDNSSCSIRIPTPDVNKDIIDGPLGSYMKWWVRTDSDDAHGMDLLLTEITTDLSVLEVRYNASESKTPKTPVGVSAGYGILGIGVSAYCSRKTFPEHTVESYTQMAMDLYRQKTSESGATAIVKDLGPEFISGVKARKVTASVPDAPDQTNGLHYLLIHKERLYDIYIEGQTTPENPSPTYISNDRILEVKKIVEGIILTQ